MPYIPRGCMKAQLRAESWAAWVQSDGIGRELCDSKLQARTRMQAAIS